MRTEQVVFQMQAECRPLVAVTDSSEVAYARWSVSFRLWSLISLSTVAYRPVNLYEMIE
jgi:hypothetical protein